MAMLYICVYYLEGRRGRIVSKKFQAVLSNKLFKMAALMGSKKVSKQSMYGVSESFNENEELRDSSDNESNSPKMSVHEHLIPCVNEEKSGSDSDSEHIVSNQVAVGDHLSTELDAAEVPHFRVGSIENDIENNLGAVKTGGNHMDDESKEIGKQEEVPTTPADNNSSSNLASNDDLSFFKVTKAAQMWKKQSDHSIKPTDTPTTQVTHKVEVPAATSVGVAPKPAKETATPNRRQTYISERSNSIVVARSQQKSEKKHSFTALVVILRDPMFQSFLAWWVQVDVAFQISTFDEDTTVFIC